jgi:uncharacterized membrane protein YbhN (UPF0104 family)
VEPAADGIIGISQVAHGLATPARDTARRWSATRVLITAGSAALAAFLLWRTFRNVEMGAVRALLSRTGPMIALPLLGYLLTMTVDSLGWRRLLAAVGWNVPLARIVALRISIEGIQLSLPWGSVISESLTPALLRRRFGIALPPAVAATAARKCLFALTQSVFVAAAAILGGSALATVALSTGVPALRAAFLGVAAVLLVAGTIPASMLASGALAGAVRRRLEAVRLTPLRRFLERQQAAFGSFDAHAAHLFHPSRLATTAPFVFGVWLAETTETWLLLNVLGVPVSFVEAIPIEAGASVLRILGVAVPAGLGVQEVGYVAFIAATGVPDPASYGAAFALMKRAKEALWTLIGYTLLLRWRS